jgi:glycosyltransferase involved in cell wall biosynthesis
MNTYKKDPVVLLLDPRGISKYNSFIVTNRLDEYAKQLNLKSSDNSLGLVVLSSSKSHKIKNKILKYVKIYYISKPTFNFLLFAMRSFNFIKSSDLEVKLIVVADPWESYWCAFFLVKLSRTSIPIQIQVHGDFADPRWSSLSLQNRIRNSLTKLSLLRADSIRAVSKHQAKNLIENFGLEPTNIQIIPVPVFNHLKFRRSRLNRPRTIGFVGRIHKDRGIWEFVKLIKILAESSHDFSIVIAGTGPDQDLFLKKLKLVSPAIKIEYLGQIPNNKMSSVWTKIGVLVSMAPVESYGLAMREALLHGIPVWATASAGVKDLMDNYKKGEVKLLDLSKCDTTLDKDFKLLLKTKVSADFSKKFIKENNTYATKLANSWITIVNKSK